MRRHEGHDPMIPSGAHMVMEEGDPSPHDDGGVVTMVNSARLGHQRPYCTGCGSPLDGGGETQAETFARRLKEGYERQRTAQSERDNLYQQIDRLAQFILDEVPGEPSQDQGAVDTAIRVIREYKAALLEWWDDADNPPGLAAHLAAERNHKRLTQETDPE